MDYALIGKTLGHSFSKIVHEALTDYHYELAPLPTDEIFQQFMEERNFSGINVTIPYKQAVIPYCEEIDQKAKSIGAINTIVNRDGKLYGYNTDYDGFLYMAQKKNIQFQGKVILILGTGGTFKTVRTVAEDQGAKTILVASRTPKEEGIIDYETAKTHQEVNIIINTSPVGMYPDNQSQPISLAGFPNLEGVLDVVYNPLYSTLIQEAKALGIPCSGGLPMLVAQAKYAAEHFQGKTISDEAMNKVVAQIARRQSNLVLIGMPSSGKSTLGRWCAKDMHRKFIDLDHKLEKREGRSIPDIFREDGEEHFRKLETELCQEFSKENGLVISTGGGVVTRPENIQALKQNAVLIYVSRDQHSLDVGGHRPLSKSPEALATMFQERDPLYRKACHRQIENNQLVNTVAKKIKEAYYEVFSTEWT